MNDSNLKVHEGHGDETGHDEQHDERDEENPEQGVNLVAPHAREDVVELDVNGRKRQKARHEHLRQGLAVPGNVFGNLTRHLSGCSKRKRKSINQRGKKTKQYKAKTALATHKQQLRIDA